MFTRDGRGPGVGAGGAGGGHVARAGGAAAAAAGDHDELNTPLHLAAKDGNADLVRSLLSQGAVANVRNRAGRAPLHLLIASLRILARIPYGSGLEPELAHINNHIVVAEYLINAGADINPMTCALRCYSLPAFRQLKEILERRRSALDESYRSLLIKIVNCPEDGDRHKQLQFALEEIELLQDILRRNEAEPLISQLITPTITFDEITVLLVYAARCGNNHVVQQLIRAGADVSRPYQMGGVANTALLEAVANEHIAVAGTLLKAGAHVNWSSNTGVTAIWWADALQNEELKNLLSQRGGDFGLYKPYGR